MHPSMDIHEVANLDFCARITRLVLGAGSRPTARARNAGVGSADASVEERQLSRGLSGSPGRRCSGTGVGVSQLPDTDCHLLPGLGIQTNSVSAPPGT